MTKLDRRAASLRFPVALPLALCGLGSALGLYVAIARIPVLATSRLELLMGTLLGTAISLLFAVAGLLVALTYLIWRESRRAAIRIHAKSEAARR